MRADHGVSVALPDEGISIELTAVQESVILAWYRTGRFPARQGHAVAGLMRRGLVESRCGFLTWTEQAERVAEELVARREYGAEGSENGACAE